MQRKLLLTALIGLSAIGFNAAAHGPSKSQHGGIVQTASDLSFELVPGATTSSLYVVDHDQPADVSKMSGKLSILVGTNKTDVDLKPAGGNKLEAAAKIESGARVVATVNTPAGKAVTVRFAVK